MYFKDNIRKWANRLLRIDKHFLSRMEVLNAVSDYSYHGHVYTCEFGNRQLTLRNLSSDFEVFQQVFLEQEYAFAGELFENKFGVTPKIIIDAGANVGFTSLYFQKKYPVERIFALEPENDNFGQLLKNTQGIPQISCQKKALWKNSGLLNMTNNFRDRRSWSFRVNEGEGFEQIEATTLSSFVQEHGLSTVDILKIDIEGAEKEVLLEDEMVDSVLVNTKLVCLEIHDSEVSRIAVTEKFTALGFEIFAKGETLFCVRK